MKQVTLLAIILLISNVAISQNLINGIISDESGALAGANVVIKNTSIGVATNINGKFEIKASPKDTLSISYIGYEPKDVLLGDLKNVNITLDSFVKLDEVIIKTYATTTRSLILDCGFTYETIYDVSEVGETKINSSKLFPNPSSNGIFQLNLYKNYYKVELVIATITGNIIQSNSYQDLFENIELDLSNCPSGIYIINIIADGERLTPKKAIIK